MAAFSNINIQWYTRSCTVKGRPGEFHTWEQWSKPLPASPLQGGPPAGVMSMVFGIVEFSDGIQRVDPVNIKFCDDQHQFICDYEKFLEDKESKNA